MNLENDEDCIYQNVSAKEWAEMTNILNEELADIKGQLNVYKPMLLRLVIYHEEFYIKLLSND